VDIKILAYHDDVVTHDKAKCYSLNSL